VFGDDASGTTLVIPEPAPPYFSVAFAPHVSVNSNNLKLKCGPDVELALTDAWGSAKVIASAQADFDDTLTVPTIGSVHHGYLHLTWTFDGTFGAIEGDGDASSRVQRAYISQAQLWAEYQPQGGTNSLLPIAEEHFNAVAGGEGPPNGQYDFSNYFRDDQLFISDLRFDTEKSIIKTVNEPVTVRIPWVEGVPVEVGFHLFAGLNLRYDNYDSADMTVEHYARFDNTATLTGLSVLDENFNWIAGSSVVISEANISYPAGNIPEPSTLVILTFAAPLVCRRRRRQ
jgi:hypothetical protein